MRQLTGAGRTVVAGQARRRCSVVLAVVVVLGAVPVLLAHRPVPATGITPAALRDRIAASAGQVHQGYAQSAGALGLPALPNLEQVTALVSGTTEMRVWRGARDRWRVDVLGPGTEQGLYQLPGEQYLWDYGESRLTRIVGEQPLRLPRAADLTPPELVRRLLSLAAGDRVEPLPGKRVAGVVAAGLRVVPVAPGTTVAHIDVWADPDSGLPLQAEITARGARRPVFVTRFLEVSLTAPAAAVLDPPVPGPGIGAATTSAADVLAALDRWDSLTPPDSLAGYPRQDSVDGVPVVGVYGTGLARFVALGLPGRLGDDVFGNAARWGRRLTVSGGEAVLITAGLLNVLAVRAERTYLVTGFVDAPLLERVAADLAGGTA
ncbi:hypothetical protein [Actinoplanes auranticolor]|uniref:MucB/RseB-like sigma(E) regulatory protein n=1 Tax=Actinoplanes auranticolor TaxID=47988 RepID=A0A919S3B9_9ACTN|nr:hypothetical protein [Actinoplanes auranticolor]GIM64027.1 hypothetical protein Aau02nite_07900 [Actinoplanes auranticolor]